MSLSTRLKDATWASHQSAESRPWQKSLARGAAPAERLGVYLAQLLPIHEALERGMDADPALAAALGWCDAMRHSRRLQTDLAELEAGAVAPLPATRALLDAIAASVAAEPASLLGYLYVLEGSMNGNRFLLRALRRGAAGRRCALAYFDPYGDAQPARWLAFKDALDRLALDPEEEAAAVSAALAAFDGVTAVSGEMVPRAPDPTLLADAV